MNPICIILPKPSIDASLYYDILSRKLLVAIPRQEVFHHISILSIIRNGNISPPASASLPDYSELHYAKSCPHKSVT